MTKRNKVDKISVTKVINRHECKVQKYTELLKTKKEGDFTVSGISKMLLIVFVLFILQALGGWYQIQNYRKAMRRVHQYGNVGFGQRKGRLTAGYIIMIACDHDGIITRCEIMQGLSFLAKFKPLNEFLGKDMKGRSIYEFLDDMKDFDKKQKKKYKGYINAFEALDQRLQDTKLEADQKEAVSQEAQDALA